jgi:hypothetical protein
MARLVDDQGLNVRRLLLYLSNNRDPQRYAVGPALAAAAERAGWAFDCYYAATRRGRHFGGGDPEAAELGVPNGSLVAGGSHLDQAFRLAALNSVVAYGDPECVLWSPLEAAGAEVGARSLEPADLYAAAFDRLKLPLPERLIVVDSTPQGRDRVILAPYLYPEFLTGAAVGLEATADRGTLERVVALGATEIAPRYVSPDRSAALGIAPGGDQVLDESFAALTVTLAQRHESWGTGVFLGDPELVAAQLPRAARLRLIPLYGRPQTDAIRLASRSFERASSPVYGRQYDDRDFFELGKHGLGFQLVDPDPPFDSALADAPSGRSLLEPDEPDDNQLRRWAAERRVLVSLLFWSGMVRELDCVPRLTDVLAISDARAGLVITTPAVESGLPLFDPITAPPSEGGVGGRLEILLASAGDGVCAEALMPADTLETSLRKSRERAESLLGVPIRGWWPLMDASLHDGARHPFARRGRRPVLLFTPRRQGGVAEGSAPQQARDLRAAVRSAVRAAHLESLFDERRPFESQRPGVLAVSVAQQVHRSGFEYMWTKTAFGTPGVSYREGDFVALALTAGRWEGWSPFYTLAGVVDLAGAEKRLLKRDAPGWLVGTIDAPLWALSGEILERGPGLLEMARFAADGGRSGELVNVTPNVVARYARIIEQSGASPVDVITRA